MKTASLLIFLFISCLAFADQKGGTDYPSPNNSYMAKVKPFKKSKYGTEEFEINIISKSKGVIFHANYKSNDGEHGQSIGKVAWSIDSNFFIFNTFSSGGHQAWHSPTYVFSIQDSKLRSIDTCIGAVIDQKFSLSENNNLKVIIQNNKPIEVNLAKLLKQCKPVNA